MQQIKKQYDTIFEEIYVSFYSRLKRFATEYVIREEDAENIVHDVFLELWEQRQFIGNHVNISAFLFTSIKNRCIDFIRHKTIGMQVADKLQEEYLLSLHIKIQSLETFDDKIFSETDIEQIINSAIDALPDKCKQIFILNKIEGRKQKDIAQELNISINTVESQMAIAYKKLKETLKDYVLLLIFFFI